MILRCSNVRGETFVNRSGARRVNGGGLAGAGFSQTTLEKGMMMKQLISVLVAALFAAASVSAIAQDKKADPAEKKAMKAEKTKKPAKATKSTKKPKGEAKKGEPSKKDEAKK